MKNEYTVLQALATVIGNQIGQYIDVELPTLTSDNVLIDFPNTDKMPKNSMIYVQPDFAEYQALATQNDQASFRVSVFVICKRDTQAELSLKYLSYFNALYELLRTNTDLDGAVDFVDIINTDFYPAIEGDFNVKGVEISVSVRYTKDF